MNEKALKLLAIGPGGEVNPDPLVEWRFRFSPRAKRWTRISRYAKGSFRRGLPRVVSQAKVAEEVGVPEQVLADWQAALIASKSGTDGTSPESKLAIGPDGPIHRSPLVDWHFEFFPRSGVWRRTRGQRSEVSRQSVAKKVGVSEELIEQWEKALTALRERESQDPD